LPVILRNEFKHIDHQYKNVTEKGFFILNKFKSEMKNPTMEDVIKYDLLNEDYFSTEEQKIENQKQLDQYTSYAKMVGAYEVDENENTELYGPILKDKIQFSDFKKLDYISYLTEMENYVIKWTDEGWDYLVESFQDFHLYSLRELNNNSAEKRDYYFLDSELVDKTKLYEVNWYDYFFCVVSTLDSSNEVIIMNFGND
jgi:hypothetical protein